MMTPITTKSVLPLALLAPLLVLFTAACGGGGQSNSAPPTAAFTPTPVATLTVDERLSFPAGQIENPIQMVFVPTDTVLLEVQAILRDEYRLAPAQLTPQSDLPDFVELEVLNTNLQQKLGVSITTLTDTIGNLVTAVQGRLGTQLADHITEAANLYVEVIPVADYAAALGALCNSGNDIISMAWLDGITYLAATAQNCGQPALQIAIDPVRVAQARQITPTEAESTPEATSEATTEIITEITTEVITQATTPEATAEASGDPGTSETDSETDDVPAALTGDLTIGETGVIIANNSFSATTIAFVQGRTYCRLGVEDFYSWFVPALMLRQLGLDPLRAPDTVEDYADLDSLVDAVITGDCAGTGLSERAFNSLDNQEDLQIIAQSPLFPHGVLVYPLEIQLGVRLSLTDTFVALSETPETNRALQTLLGNVALQPVDTEMLITLENFMAETGYNLALLGE